MTRFSLRYHKISHRSSSLELVTFATAEMRWCTRIASKCFSMMFWCFTQRQAPSCSLKMLRVKSLVCVTKPWLRRSSSTSRGTCDDTRTHLPSSQQSATKKDLMKKSLYTDPWFANQIHELMRCCHTNNAPPMTTTCITTCSMFYQLWSTLLVVPVWNQIRQIPHHCCWCPSCSRNLNRVKRAIVARMPPSVVQLAVPSQCRRTTIRVLRRWPDVDFCRTRHTKKTLRCGRMEAEWMTSPKLERGKRLRLERDNRLRLVGWTFSWTDVTSQVQYVPKNVHFPEYNRRSRCAQFFFTARIDGDLDKAPTTLHHKLRWINQSNRG